jgi:YVTN family beta-propeller protein
MTLEAWVAPDAIGGWRTILLKETSSDLSYALYASGLSSNPVGYLDAGGTNSIEAVTPLSQTDWTHLALTFDGQTIRFYENAIEVASQPLVGGLSASAGPLQIGGNSIWGEYYQGRIDEVRVYERVLGAAEIQTDLLSGGTPAGPQLQIDSPSDGATISGTTVDVTYSVVGDLSEVSHVHFRLDGGADMMDPPPIDGVFQLSNVLPGSHVLDGYLVRSDHSTIGGSNAPTISFTTTVPDIEAPVVVLIDPRDGDTLIGVVPITISASDNVGVAGVQLTLNGEPVGSELTVAPYSDVWNTATVPNGTYVMRATARDAAGNTSDSIAITVTIANPDVASGLVAAFGFDEGGGSIALDTSGNANDGIISGATRSTNGRFGKALAFDGTNDLVTVPDTNALDLTDGMTLEAWIQPTTLNDWRTVILKKLPGGLAYGIYASNTGGRPAGYITAGGEQSAQGTAALAIDAWTHVALTYDATSLRLYENGVEIASSTSTAPIATSAEALQIGGNSIWGEFFEGLIDEVRIYDRARTPDEIQVDMDKPVTPTSLARPTRSSPIVVDAAARRVWVVNPDNDSVAAIDADTLQLEFEVPVGAHPVSLAVDGSGLIWIACQDDDSLWILDGTTGQFDQTLALPRGSAPVAIVFGPDGTEGFVSAHGTGLVYQVDPVAASLGATLDVGRAPQALAVTSDGGRLLVTQLISDDTGGRVRTLDLATFTPGASLDMPVDTTSVDGPIAARGLPNYLAGIAINPLDDSAWVVAKKDNILRGLFRDGQALTFETSVRALVGLLDLTTNSELLARRLDIDDHGQPSAVALSGSGEHVFVTMQGNNNLIVLNPLGGEIVRAQTGLAPQGIDIDPVTRRVFTKNLMSRDVSVFDASQLIGSGLRTLPILATVTTVAVETMPPDVLLGKQIFYDASDPRMGADGYISCALCHLDGGHDGRVWDFTDRGEGLRNTISLRGQAGDAGAPLHWSGNFDEVQDFENDIRGPFGGAGFMSDVEFLTGTRADPLGDLKAGVSAALDALAAYVNSLSDSGKSPYRAADGSMTPDALAGATIFSSLGCASCHSGPRFSDSPTGLRHDVGTIKPSSGQRISGFFDGVDTPTLIGLWDTAPYLHDGSAASLVDVLTTQNTAGLHGDVSGLTPAELNQLLQYLLQLEFGSQ